MWRVSRHCSAGLSPGKCRPQGRRYGKRIFLTQHQRIRQRRGVTQFQFVAASLWVRGRTLFNPVSLPLSIPLRLGCAVLSRVSAVAASGREECTRDRPVLRRTLCLRCRFLHLASLFD
jgi:hypothetical protein